MSPWNKKIFNIFLIIAIFICFTPTQANSMNRYEKKRRFAQAKIRKLKFLESLETNKMYRNQQRLEQNETNLKDTGVQYSSAQQRLDSIQRQLSVSLQTYSISEFQAKNRIRQIYKKQRTGLFQLLLSTNDLNLFLDRIYYQNLIAKNDKYKLRYVREKARRIARLKFELQQQKLALASAMDSMRSQKQNIKSDINANQSMIEKLKSDRAAYERSERELARQSASLQRMIYHKTGHSEVHVASGFIWPVHGMVTSPFGYRVHPIFHSRIFHSGLDIAAPYGTPVRASNSGRVLYSGWYGGYGKVVIIDHGRYNGVPTSTLYGHLSSYSVSAGDYVTRGQVVANEGTTGYSTGPHVHFEVRTNGQPSNPLSYI